MVLNSVNDLSDQRFTVQPGEVVIHADIVIFVKLDLCSWLVFNNSATQTSIIFNPCVVLGSEMTPR